MHVQWRSARTKVLVFDQEEPTRRLAGSDFEQQRAEAHGGGMMETVFACADHVKGIRRRLGDRVLGQNIVQACAGNDRCGGFEKGAALHSFPPWINRS